MPLYCLKLCSTKVTEKEKGMTDKEACSKLDSLICFFDELNEMLDNLEIYAETKEAA